MVKAKIYVFEKQFDGLPKQGDLKLMEEELPPIKDGEFLSEAIYLSVDPYMRAYAPNLPLGSVFIGSQVAKILESKHPSFPVGRYVVGYFGWRSHTISDGKRNTMMRPAALLLPDLGDAPLSCALGVLGMPGSSAYFGFLEICQPQKRETVVVSGAAGAVGSIVGQIAKIKGCKVIGIAGSDEKGKWLIDELGFDHFINYKTTDIDNVLTEIAPDGVDCYFDNVGGDISIAIIRHINEFGRISLSGTISTYNKIDRAVKIDLLEIVLKQIKMEGFVISNRWKNREFEGIQQNLKWIQEGKLKYKETITEGFENTFKAFVEMLQGKNFGKAIVKV